MDISHKFPCVMALLILVTLGCDQAREELNSPAGVSAAGFDPGQPIEKSRQRLTDAGLRLGEAISYGPLKIVPVHSIEPRDEDKYITLDEGLQAGTVEVLETGVANSSTQSMPDVVDLNPQEDTSPSSGEDHDVQVPINDIAVNDIDLDDGMEMGNQVNQVMVINRSDKPLYLMPGEIILGGDQDRSIATECLIAADGVPTPVPVFCVEHGRWGNRDGSSNMQLLAQVAENIRPELVQDSDAIESLSKKADKDQFVASPTVASKSVRIAVQKSADQSKVWEEVAKVNAKSGASSQSGSLTANYTQKATTQLLEPYRAALREPVGDLVNVVGVVVVIDGKPQAVDVFGSTPLFKKLWPKLLEGYALDAATHDEESSAKTEYAPDDTIRFLAQVLDQSSDEGVRQGTVSQQGSVIAASAAYENSDESAADFMAMPLHIAGFNEDPQSAVEGGDLEEMIFETSDQVMQVDDLFAE